MKILLISTNSEKSYPYPVPPIGAGYVYETLSNRGHDVDFIDFCFQENWKLLLENQLKNFLYDLILLSIRNIDNCLFPKTREYISFNKKVVQICKNYTDTPIIAGGIAVRMMKEELIDELGIEYGFTGQVSKSFISGIENFSKNTILTYPGFISSKNNEENTFSDVLPLHPNSDFYRSINIPQYIEQGGVVGFQTKYGCDLGCIYCSYPIIEGKKIVCYEPKEIVKTITTVVKENNLKFFEFADSTFNYPLSHAKSICKLLIRENLDVGWSAFMSPKFCDKEFFELCKQSGCTGIDFGIDSASNKMLKNLHKGFTTDDIKRASEYALGQGLHICFNLLFGGPGETIETIEETFGFLEQYPNCAVSAYSALRVYPGTPLEKIAREEGEVEGNLLYPKFYISKEIRNDLNKILSCHRKKHPEWMLRGITDPPKPEVIKRFGKNRNSPLWVEKEHGILSRRNNDSN